eukprot:scaffold46362_cov163-Isochrysis_galbana.AAC.1
MGEASHNSPMGSLSLRDPMMAKHGRTMLDRRAPKVSSPATTVRTRSGQRGSSLGRAFRQTPHLPPLSHSDARLHVGGAAGGEGGDGGEGGCEGGGGADGGGGVGGGGEYGGGRDGGGLGGGRGSGATGGG